MSGAPGPLLAIVGPTAVGKSALALELAERQGGEIVSCDSVQVFRGFVVGCAKPGLDEQRRVPHHLLDVAAWNEAFDAARWAELARTAIAAIRARRRRPIVCGGTGLYLRALRFGLVDVPAADAELRERLISAERADPGSSYARLERLDPDSAAAVPANNEVQVLRALEILELTGEPASRVRARHGFRGEETAMHVVYLERARADLRARIAARSSAMVEGGLLGEVEGLLRSGVSRDCRPMRSVGYREAAEVLTGEASAAGLAERIAARTWQYARRQKTWFKREPGVVRLAPADAMQELAALGATVSAP